MNRGEEHEPDTRLHADWDSHYNVPEGKDKVDTRQTLYTCVEEGRTPVDYDEEVITVLQHLDVASDAMILDIGCSKPDFLRKFRKLGYVGLLFGVDPNSKQFGGRPFWQPTESESTHWHDEPIDMDTIMEQYELVGTDELGDEGIILIEATANRIPIPDKMIDFITEMFSFYHVEKHRQTDAILEIMRLLDYGGSNAMTLSGNDNKVWMHAGQGELAALLSDRLKRPIIPPPPLHRGFTTEDALSLLPSFFRNVRTKFIEERLVFDSDKRRQIVMDAHTTQADMFKDVHGRPVEFELFQEVLEEVVGKQLDDGMRSGRPMTDKASRAIIIASQVSLGDLPEDYETIIEKSR